MAWLRRFVSIQLPRWAQHDHALLRYVRGQRHRRPYRRVLPALVLVGVGFILTLISPLATQSGLVPGMDHPGEWRIYRLLYFPLLMIQWYTLTLALIVPANAIMVERQHGTWEAFKMTSHGAELFIRARWAAILYQMRLPLLVVLAARVLFAGLMLMDVSRKHGYYLDLYRSGITPAVPLEGSILLLAALMTAALLQFPALLALYAALGLLIATVIHHPAALLTARLVLLIGLIVIVGLAMVAGGEVLNDKNSGVQATPRSVPAQWISLLLIGTIGDQGLRFMDLETTLRTWPDVDYAVLLGGVLLLAVSVELVLVAKTLAWAARRAARPLKE